MEGSENASAAAMGGAGQKPRRRNASANSDGFSTVLRR